MCPEACSSIYCNSTQQLMSPSQNSQRQSQITQPNFSQPCGTHSFYSQADNWTVCRSGMCILHNAFQTFTKGPSAAVCLALCICLC